MNNLPRRALSAAIFTLSLLATSLSYADASAQLQTLQAGGAGPFSAAAGEALWLQVCGMFPCRPSPALIYKIFSNWFTLPAIRLETDSLLI